MKHFTDLNDWNPSEIRQTLELAKTLKSQVKQQHYEPHLKDNHYIMIFYKNSLRTRVSFEVGIKQLGGSSLIVNESDFALGKRESIPDVAKVLSRYVDGILIRTFDHQDVVALSEHASVPVINMLTDQSHPCQIMADVLSIEEHLGPISEQRIVYLGDGNNIFHSWLNLATSLPLNLAIATTPECLPDMKLFEEAKNAGISQVELFHDPYEAVKDATVLYTDVWASMGQKDLAQQKEASLQAFQINQDLVSHAADNAIVMHCLPAERGKEITADVIDGPQSIVWDQAENRLHAQKAILVQLNRWNHAR